MTILQSGVIPSTGGYQISRSLRFNSADSAYLDRTPASSGSLTTWTFSTWIKLGSVSTSQTILAAGLISGTIFYNRLAIGTDGSIGFFNYPNTGPSGGWIWTANVLRDPSAWYHLVFVWNTTSATSTDRMQIYVNGTRVTNFVTNTFAPTFPAQNTQSLINNSSYSHRIGRTESGQAGGNFLDSYLAETYFIDGQALTPSSFGRNNPSTGVWEPIAYTGTYGTNGFELSFADNSNTTAATLGKDYSGNGNNWTPNNFSVTAGSGNDSLVDTPTSYGTDTGVGGEVRGNYATTSPINQVGTALTLANGNLDFTQGSSLYGLSVCTMSIRDKTYFEITINATGVGRNSYDGVGSSGSANAYSSGGFFGTDATAWSLGYSNTTAYISNNGVQSTQSGTIANGDVFMYAVDPANGRIWFGRNGTWYAGNPSAGTGASYTNLPSEVWPVVQAYNSGAHSINFGQRPFAYTAPSGFKALCTQNLPTPTIGATSTTQANQYFNVLTYAGSASNQTISGLNFQPDFIWFKERTTAGIDHFLLDSVRNNYGSRLQSNTTNAEAATNAIISISNTGYTLTGGVSTTNDAFGRTYVTWNWNAGGSNATNTSGTITSTVRANTTAGFSIVTYTGTGANATVGHGLGVAPSMIICKGRSTTDNWIVYHASLGNQYAIYLNLTNAQAGPGSLFWNSTTPTSSVFSLGGSSAANTNGATQVAYCFAAVAGYSAFGSYTGNGSSDGPFVYTGFRPRFLLYKPSNRSLTDWVLWDTARQTYNVCGNYLLANTSGAEGNATTIDLLSNGFKLRTTTTGNNGSGDEIIYAAFAESPFKFSLAR